MDDYVNGKDISQFRHIGFVGEIESREIREVIVLRESKEEGPAKRTERILVVDDDEQFLTMVERMLLRHGFTVVAASTVSEALEAFREKPTQLVITDIVMPERSGMELLQALKGEYSYLKVIAVSGGPGGKSAWLPIAQKLGAVRVIKKPFRQEQLIEAVKEVLAGSEYSV